MKAYFWQKRMDGKVPEILFAWELSRNKTFLSQKLLEVYDTLIQAWTTSINSERQRLKNLVRGQRRGVLQLHFRQQLLETQNIFTVIQKGCATESIWPSQVFQVTQNTEYSKVPVESFEMVSTQIWTKISVSALQRKPLPSSESR